MNDRGAEFPDHPAQPEKSGEVPARPSPQKMDRNPGGAEHLGHPSSLGEGGHGEGERAAVAPGDNVVEQDLRPLPGEAVDDMKDFDATIAHAVLNRTVISVRVFMNKRTLIVQRLRSSFRRS
ncbi:MAG: hypothetical protein NTV79_05305 [Candidatus Aureabacteria bacterium]|nr:hypothetical protein [Candidatus Auribacterota bacterium]